MDKFQVIVLVFGLFFAGGFAFGGIINFGTMTGGLSGGNSQQQQERVTMPSSTFSDGKYNLSLRDKQRLARNNDVVFVSLLYRNESQRQQLEGVQDIRSNFNDRMYVDLVNESETLDFTRFGFNEFPKAVAVGAGGAGVIDEPTASNIGQTACGQYAQWNSLAPYCAQ